MNFAKWLTVLMNLNNVNELVHMRIGAENNELEDNRITITIMIGIMLHQKCFCIFFSGIQ